MFKSLCAMWLSSEQQFLTHLSYHVAVATASVGVTPPYKLYSITELKCRAPWQISSHAHVEGATLSK